MARTLADCLDELKKGGEISDAEWARIRGAFEDRRGQHRLALGDEEAARKAAEDIAADMAFDAAEKKRRAAIDARILPQRAQELQDFRRPDGRPDINEAAMRMVQRIEHRKHAVEATARAMIADFLDVTRRTKLSGKVRNPALIEDVIGAWHGDGGKSPEAIGFAQALDKAYEWLRQRYNDAGGHAGKLENYGGPHWHDARALRAAGFDTWKAAILPKLDPEKTGMAMAGRPFSAGELEATLRPMFEKITTEGWNGREPMFRAIGAGSIASRHADPRMLHFKSGKDWLDYNRDFGTGEPFHAVMQGISSYARDIAAMETLGTNPDGAMHWLRQVVLKHGHEKAAGRPSLARKEGETAINRAQWTDHRLDAMWSNLKGASLVPVSETGAAIGGGLRAYATARLLKNAFLSSLGDIGTQKLARAYDGVGGSTLADITAYLATYRMSRDEATRAGLLVDSSLMIFHDQARYAKAWDLHGLANKAEGGSMWLADRVLAFTFLTPWTHAGRHIFGFSFFGEVADNAGKRFADMPAHLLSTFKRYGLNETDWNVIRAADIHVPQSGLNFSEPSRSQLSTKAGFIRPADIMAAAEGPALPKVQQILGLSDLDEKAAAEQVRRGVQDIATRYLEMVLAETEYAVPTSTVRARTIILGKNQPGTIMGETGRIATQFRAYPLVFGLLWGQRVTDDALRGGSWQQRSRGAGYGVGVFATATLLGGLSMQLKNMAAGMDPAPMNPTTPEGRKNIGSAVAQGAGLGLYSDFLFADANRYGGSWGASMLGPVGGDIENLYRLFAGPIQRAGHGKDDDKASSFGRDLAQIGRSAFPSTWYLDLAAQRLLFDTLQRLADPEADKAFDRKIKQRERERGQGFWWAPGEDAPARWPDLGSIAR